MESINKQFWKSIRKLSRNRGKIEFSKIYDIFESIYHKYVSQNEYDARLMDLLKSFRKNELILFPKGEKYWDMTKSVPLPLWIKIPSEKKEKISRPWREEIWIPQMSWIMKINRMSSKTHDDLRRINNFVKTSDDKLLFPEKERSIQLFGDEKRLRVLQTAYGKYEDLFGLTNSYKTHKPLTYQEFSTKNSYAIILENRDTFDSFCRINNKLKIPKYKYIIFGDGIEILERYDEILRFKKVPLLIEYFGDLDPTGIYIAQLLQKKIQTDECKVTLNYFPYYKRLVELYKNQEWIFTLKPQKNPYTIDFVPENDKNYIKSLFRENKRIPQELLNIREISLMLDG